ncbi:hypothetical protein [Pseudonocardia halophobica]|nr:hypothetical protein [Pseudonocardia halophobica]
MRVEGYSNELSSCGWPGGGEEGAPTPTPIRNPTGPRLPR